MCRVSPTLCPVKLSTTNPDLNLLNPVTESFISKDSASLSSKLNAVIDSTFSRRVFNVPISLMVNLCVLNLFICTSVGLNVNAGKNIVASFIALSKSFGCCGLSDELPSTIWKLPNTSKNMEANFGR